MISVRARAIARNRGRHEDRFAFTAKYWGDAAVVCRAVEGRPGPIVNQEFGEFETWTQANAFATRLNEGLEINPAEAEQIITSAVLRASELLRGADYPEIASDAVRSAAAGRAIRVQFILAELELGATFCRIVRSKGGENAERLVRNARSAFFSAMHYLQRSELVPRDVEAITTRLVKLQEALQESLPQQESAMLAERDGWAGSV
jgi:hypothetical protein